MKLTRRSLFKLGTITAAGLALPATDILADAEEIAKRYWALDQTHLDPTRSHLASAEEYAAVWWDVATIVGENRYHTTIQTEVVPDHLRVGDALAIGDLPIGATAIDGLERQTVHIRHIDRPNGIVTVTTPRHYPNQSSPHAERLRCVTDPIPRDQVWLPNPYAYGKW